MGLRISPALEASVHIRLCGHLAGLNIRAARGRVVGVAINVIVLLRRQFRTGYADYRSAPATDEDGYERRVSGTVADVRADPV